jgi:hypothetical protein
MTARELENHHRAVIAYMAVPAATANARLRELARAIDAGSSRMFDERWRARERAARALVLASLPRGFKWAIDHPRLLRVARRLHIWRPPVMRVLPY